MQEVFEFCRDRPIRPKRPERLFFALLPEASVAQQVARAAAAFIRAGRMRGTCIRPERLHISLHHVGDFRRLHTQILVAARQAGDAVAMRPFEVTLHTLQSFGSVPADGGQGRHPLVLLGEGSALVDLHRRLAAAMRSQGLRAAAHFRPHMTLYYGVEAVPARAIEPVRFTVDRFTLVHSELGLTRHNVVKTWMLRG